MQSFIAGKNEAGMRLDKLIERVLPQAGKGFAYKMLRKKNIVLNGKRAEGNERLCEGDEVRFFLSDETFEGFGGRIPQSSRSEENGKKTGGAGLLSAGTKAERGHTAERSLAGTDSGKYTGFDFASNVIYEDEDVLLVNKPEGILSQKAVPEDISLNEYLIGYVSDTEGRECMVSSTFRPSVCNRLDRNTSGIVCCGVSMKGLRMLSQMFRERTVHKYYLALCKGEIKTPAHRTAYLTKDEKTNKVTVSKNYAEGAETIETAWKPLCFKDGCTLLEVELFTGKSHQIRAQLAFEGYPIVGDNKYGDAMFNRIMRDRYKVRSQMLAAYRIVFPECESLPKVSGKEFKDKMALTHPLWKNFMTDI